MMKTMIQILLFLLTFSSCKSREHGEQNLASDENTVPKYLFDKNLVGRWKGTTEATPLEGANPMNMSSPKWYLEIGEDGNTGQILVTKFFVKMELIDENGIFFGNRKKVLSSQLLDYQIVRLAKNILLQDSKLNRELEADLVCAKKGQDRKTFLQSKPTWDPSDKKTRTIHHPNYEYDQPIVLGPNGKKFRDDEYFKIEKYDAPRPQFGESGLVRFIRIPGDNPASDRLALTIETNVFVSNHRGQRTQEITYCFIRE